MKCASQICPVTPAVAMKFMVFAVCFMLTLALNAAGPRVEDMALYNARKKGALICECLRVVDQDGEPVADAKIWGGLQTGDGLNDNTPVRGMTDTNGEYVVQGKVTRIFHCEISKRGYYTSMRDFIYGEVELPSILIFTLCSLSAIIGGGKSS